MTKKKYRDLFDGLLHSDLVADMHYCPNTGIFTRRQRCSNMAAGTMCGAVNNEGYVVIRISRTGKRYQAHRLAWFYVHKNWPREQIDHINGNRSDNRICNLREVTPHQNRLNKGILRNNTSGLKGVYQFKGKWKAQIQFNKTSRFLGMFASKEAAHAAYLLASHQLFGEFTREDTSSQPASEAGKLSTDAID